MFRFKCLFIFFLLLFLAGCINEETTIMLNPDGSGTAVFSVDFDNASEEQRNRMKAYLQKEEFNSPFESSKLKNGFPSLYFEILEISENRDGLRGSVSVKFTDINRLLLTDVYGMKGLDFEVKEDALLFVIDSSLQDAKRAISAGAPDVQADFDKNTGPNRKLTILNAGTGESIEFSHKYNLDNKEENIKWSALLNMPGHTIVRRDIKDSFADYPNVGSITAIVTEASWIRKVGGINDPSCLSLDMNVPVPNDEYTYVGWCAPIILSGKFNNGSLVVLTDNCKKLAMKFDEKKNFFFPLVPGCFNLPLEVVFPAKVAKRVDQMMVRLLVTRGKKLQHVELGAIKPEHRYDYPPFVFKSKDLKNNRLHLKITGPLVQLKEFSVRTKRGNVFPLKKASWSDGRDHGYIEFRTFLPLNELALVVKFYEPVEHCWLDVKIPSMDLISHRPYTTKSKVLTNELEGDMDMAKEVLEDPSYEVFTRSKALRALLKHSENISLAYRILEDTAQDNFLRSEALTAIVKKQATFNAEFIKPYVIEPKLRNTTINNIVKFKVTAMCDEIKHGRLSYEEFKKSIAPLIPVFEDLAEQVNERDRKTAAEILEMFKTGVN